MTTPWPPGSAQTPPSLQEMMAYLDQLGTWIGDERRELDRVDQKLQQMGQTQGLQDLSMTLTVWQAISDRYADLVRTWDSGRVTDADLKKLAVMTWSNLNDMLTPGTTLSSAGGLALSLPEACRMLEALIAQLSSRYQLAPMPTQTSARITALLAQVDRIRDQSKLDPPDIQKTTQPEIDDLDSDLKDLIAKADRGGDVGGILGPLEIRAAHLERDLIVGNSERRMLADRITEAASRRDQLAVRQRQVADLVQRTLATVNPAPKYAVPRVEALGDVPHTAPELDAYLARLNQVSAALDIVQNANEKACAVKDSLAARMRAAEISPPSGDLASSLAAQIHTLLNSSPVPVGVVSPLIDAYEAAGRKQ